MFSQLMSSRRFAPLFWSQLLAALNDNLLKNALAMLVVYRLAMENGPAIGTLAGAALILPFFLFSALAGQYADKFDKAEVAARVRLDRNSRCADGRSRLSAAVAADAVYSAHPLRHAQRLLRSREVRPAAGPSRNARAARRQRPDRRRDLHRHPARHDRRQPRIGERDGTDARCRRHRRDIDPRLAVRARHSAGAFVRARSRRRHGTS